MKNLSLLTALALLLCTSIVAQEAPQGPVQPTTMWSFTDVQYPGDTFTQLLGINNGNQIAGYHNFAVNSGFTLTLPKTVTTENYPGSAMTQVIGINNNTKTVGFYVDQAGITHGFQHQGTTYTKVDFPGSKFNQLLGQNDIRQAAGYYSMSTTNTLPDVPYIYDEIGGVFELLIIPGAKGGAQATGINNSQQISGFYIDSAGTNHGFYINQGNFMKLDAPNSTFTQALGLNNIGEVVGDYVDKGGATHGFVYTVATNTWVTVDDPNGFGTTVVNGINDKNMLVGFWGTAPNNTGFVANPLN
jgi:hypothetical protein